MEGTNGRSLTTRGNDRPAAYRDETPTPKGLSAVDQAIALVDGLSHRTEHLAIRAEALADRLVGRIPTTAAGPEKDESRDGSIYALLDRINLLSRCLSAAESQLARIETL